MAGPLRALTALTLFVVVVFAGCGEPTPTEEPSPSPTASATPSPSPSPSPTASAVASESPEPTEPAASPAGSQIPTSSPVATPAATPFPPAYPQTWVGSWVSPDTGEAGGLEFTLTQGGTTAAGTLTMDGTACLASGILSGSIGAGQVQLEVVQRGTTLTLAGVVQGLTMSGFFTMDCDDLGGTWTVQRTS